VADARRPDARRPAVGTAAGAPPYDVAVSDFVVIAGMSGAGRTQAANSLEDLGWFVIDNLPPALIPKVAELASGPGSTTPRVALVVGSDPDQQAVQLALEDLRQQGATVRTLFLDASTDVLVRRYESTKRRHPKGDASLTAAIEAERELLREVRLESDLVIDTSELSNHDLRAEIVEIFGNEGLSDTMQTTVLSFGYKYGLPADVDIVIDCRFLPNPYWDEELRPFCGLDEPVIEYLGNQEITAEFLERLEGLMELLIPAYRDEGKAYLTIAMGCTGGRHRSVAMAEALATALRRDGNDVRVRHRDMDK